jgi:hypothetical protein
MSATFTVRIPQKLKKRMEKNPAEWSQAVRDFLEERVKQMELLKTIEEIGPRAEKRETKIDSVSLIREDRKRQK